MKKLFLVVLAAGLFMACGNNDKTNDQAQEAEEPVAEVVEEPVQAQEPVAEVAPVAETKAEVKKEDKAGVSVKADKDGKATVESENVKVEANKDGGVELKINTKGTKSKGNR